MFSRSELYENALGALEQGSSDVSDYDELNRTLNGSSFELERTLSGTYGSSERWGTIRSGQTSVTEWGTGTVGQEAWEYSRSKLGELDELEIDLSDDDAEDENGVSTGDGDYAGSRSSIEGGDEQGDWTVRHNAPVDQVDTTSPYPHMRGQMSPASVSVPGKHPGALDELGSLEPKATSSPQHPGQRNFSSHRTDDFQSSSIATAAATVDVAAASTEDPDDSKAASAAVLRSPNRRGKRLRQQSPATATSPPRPVSGASAFAAGAAISSPISISDEIRQVPSLEQNVRELMEHGYDVTLRRNPPITSRNDGGSESPYSVVSLSSRPPSRLSFRGSPPIPEMGGRDELDDNATLGKPLPQLPASSPLPGVGDSDDGSGDPYWGDTHDFSHPARQLSPVPMPTAMIGDPAGLSGLGPRLAELPAPQRNVVQAAEVGDSDSDSKAPGDLLDELARVGMWDGKGGSGGRHDVSDDDASERSQAMPHNALPASFAASGRLLTEQIDCKNTAGAEVKFDYRLLRATLHRSAVTGGFGIGISVTDSGVGHGLEDSILRFRVVHVGPEGPAEIAGVHVGDHIISINGQMARELTLAEVSSVLAHADDELDLTLAVSDDPTLSLPLFRGEVVGMNDGQHPPNSPRSTRDHDDDDKSTVSTASSTSVAAAAHAATLAMTDSMRRRSYYNRSPASESSGHSQELRAIAASTLRHRSGYSTPTDSLTSLNISVTESNDYDKLDRAAQDGVEWNSLGSPSAFSLSGKTRRDTTPNKKELPGLRLKLPPKALEIGRRFLQIDKVDAKKEDRKGTMSWSHFLGLDVLRAKVKEAAGATSTPASPSLGGSTPSEQASSERTPSEAHSRAPSEASAEIFRTSPSGYGHDLRIAILEQERQRQIIAGEDTRVIDIQISQLETGAIRAELVEQRTRLRPEIQQNAWRKVVLDRGPDGFGLQVLSVSNCLYPRVSSLVPGGKAEQSGGIQLGDWTLAVNGKDMRGRTHSSVLGAIKGCESVTLLLATDTSPLLPLRSKDKKVVHVIRPSKIPVPVQPALQAQLTRIGARLGGWNDGDDDDGLRDTGWLSPAIDVDTAKLIRGEFEKLCLHANNLTTLAHQMEEMGLRQLYTQLELDQALHKAQDELGDVKAAAAKEQAASVKLIEILHEKLEKLEAEAEAHRVKIKKIESNSNSEGLATQRSAMERLEKKLEWSESALLHKEEDLISALGENQKLAVDLRRAMARLHVQHEEQFSV